MENVINEPTEPSSQELASTSLPPRRLKIAGHSDTSLRLVDLSDGPELYEVVQQDKGHLDVFQLWAEDATPESVNKAVGASVESIQAGTGLQYWIVKPDANGEERIVGSVRYREYDPATETAKLGCWLIREVEGQGIMTAAAKEFIDYSFENMSVSKLLLEIDPENIRSEKLAQRLGAKCISGVKFEEIDGKVYKGRDWEVKRG